MLKKLLPLLPPLLIAMASVLRLWDHNIAEVKATEALPLLLKITAAAALMTLVLQALLRNTAKAGAVATLWTIGLLSYGLMFHIADLLFSGHLGHKLFLPFFLGGLLFLSWRIVRGRDPAALNLFFLVSSLVLFAVPAVGVIHVLATRPDVSLPPRQPLPAFPADTQSRVSQAPRHIYYLIFDRYAANRTLKRDFGFDNQAFLQTLRSHGFHVADLSYANYTKTAHSLASSLNMTYLDDLAKQLHGGSSDFTPLFDLLQGHEVQRILHALGYRYIHMGSWWKGTRHNAHADENYSLDRGREFTDLYLQRTIAAVNTRHFSRSNDSWHKQCNRVLFKFKKLGELVERKERLFVFAHMLIPHPPFVFDENGHCMTAKESAARSHQRNYVGQVRFANHKIEEWLDRLLKRDPDAIVIIQADEGPFPERYAKDEKHFDWTQATDRELQKKFRILNALRMPGLPDSDFQPGMTPVNTFRLLFREQFGLDYPPLPDRAYTFKDAQHLYDFIDITRRVQ